MAPSNFRPPTSDLELPLGLWRLAKWGFLALLVGVIALAAAVAAGVADPKPIGSLRWEDHFAASGRWQMFGAGTFIGGDRMEIQFDEAERVGGLVAAVAAADYSFEAAAAQSAGEAGAFYGIVFDYRASDDYSAALLNGSGYVEVFSSRGSQWMPLQQWPNILLGTEANRVRIDAAGGEGLLRINDEMLLRLPLSGGGVGVIARSSAAGQRVRFGWAKLWTK